VRKVGIVQTENLVQAWSQSEILHQKSLNEAQDRNQDCIATDKAVNAVQVQPIYQSVICETDSTWGENILDIKYVFRFSLQLLFETLLSPMNV
jgi:hypothetical protein